jgi:hypothetical protein
MGNPLVACITVTVTPALSRLRTLKGVKEREISEVVCDARQHLNLFRQPPNNPLVFLFNVGWPQL